MVGALTQCLIDHLLKIIPDVCDANATLRSEDCPSGDLPDLVLILFVLYECLNVFNSICYLLHLPVVLLNPHLPGHEDAGERAQVLLLAPCPLVGDDQLVGAIRELEIEVNV
jgi:hypothetical protein